MGLCTCERHPYKKIYVRGWCGGERRENCYIPDVMRKAFTLVEMIVVMAITAAAFISLSPSFSTAAKRLNLDIAAYRTAGALMTMRQKAVTSSSQTEIKAEKNGLQFKAGDLASGTVSDRGSTLLPEGIYFDAPVTFRFAASGFPVAGFSGTAVLRGPYGSLKKVIVSSFGRIRIE